MYDIIGGDKQIRKIVETFYPKVQQHPLLAPLFPADIQPVMEKQHQFMTQLFGGPHLYSDQYGHPMMRARHLSFPIDRERADAWLACMRETLAEVGLAEPLQNMLMERFTGMAYHFMNR
jgi:hemoglobin